MAHLTNGNTTSKINRIQDEEKELLYQLRELYASDYRKYSEHIRREPHISLAIKKIYKMLDERKAYRRISDYFHRTRFAHNPTQPTKPRSSRSNGHHRSYRPSSRRMSSEPESLSAMQIVDDMDDDDVDRNESENENDDENRHQQSDNSRMFNESDETVESNQMREDDQQILQPSSSISPKQLQSSISPKPNLLAVRASIQKALRELDRAIVCKSDNSGDDYVNRSQRSSASRIDLLATGHTNLDDMVRSLSSVVSQQQDNTRSIIKESSTLLLNESNRSEKQSIRHVIDRLNGLVDRGQSIYDRIDSILSEF